MGNSSDINNRILNLMKLLDGISEQNRKYVMQMDAFSAGDLFGSCKSAEELEKCVHAYRMQGSSEDVL